MNALRPLLAWPVIGVSALLAFSLGLRAAPAIDASSPDSFASSAEAMIKAAEESGDIPLEQLAQLRMAITGAAMGAAQYALQKGGEDLTRNKGQEYATEYLRAFDGATAINFVEVAKKVFEGRTLDPVKADTYERLRQKFTELSETLSQGKNLTNGIIDIFAADQAGKKFIYQRVKYAPDNLGIPVDFYGLRYFIQMDKTKFIKGLRSGAISLTNSAVNGQPDWCTDFSVYRTLPLDEDTLRGLERNKAAGFDPAGFLPYGPSAYGSSVVYSTAPSAIDQTREVSLVRRIASVREKFFEWADVAERNKVEPFEKVLPKQSEDLDSFIFVWDGSQASMKDGPYGGSIAATTIDHSSDFMRNHADMVVKFKQAILNFEEKRERKRKDRDKLFE